MEAGLDNANNAANNPFANSNGAEILQQKEGLLLNLTEGFKQNGSEISPPSNEQYPFAEANGKRRAEEFDEDEDMGPETDVDTIDEAISSPNTEEEAIVDNKNVAVEAAAAAFDPFTASIEENSTSLEVENLLLEKQETSDFEPPKTTAREETPTPPANEVHDAGVAENVADSGEDSEDEWNYFKGDSAESEKVPSSKADQEVAALTKTAEEDEEGEMSQLNPNAAEFVPIASPTRSVTSPPCIAAIINDEVIAQSPRRTTPAAEVDINLPNPLDFEKEVKSRPSDIFSNGQDEQRLSSQEVMENFLNGKNIDEIEFHPTTPQKTSNTDEFHFGPNATPFSTPAFLDQSETALSTKAVFGDESDFLRELESEDVVNTTNQDVSDDFKTQLKPADDPMSMSFYQDGDESTPFDLNKVQMLPDDEDVDKPEIDTHFDDTISDLPEHDPLAKESLVTDLDIGVSELPEVEELAPTPKVDESVCEFQPATSPILLEASNAPLPITPEPDSEEQELSAPKTPEAVSPLPQEGALLEAVSPLPQEGALSEANDASIPDRHQSPLPVETGDLICNIKTHDDDELNVERVQEESIAQSFSESEELVCQRKSPEPVPTSEEVEGNKIVENVVEEFVCQKPEISEETICSKPDVEQQFADDVPELELSRSPIPLPEDIDVPSLESQLLNNIAKEPQTVTFDNLEELTCQLSHPVVERDEIPSEFNEENQTKFNEQDIPSILSQPVEVELIAPPVEDYLIPKSSEQEIEEKQNFSGVDAYFNNADQLLASEVQMILDGEDRGAGAECEVKSPETIEESLDSDKRDLDSPLEDITSSVKDDNSISPEIIEEAKDIATEKEIVNKEIEPQLEAPNNDFAQELSNAIQEIPAIPIEKEQIASTPNTTLNSQIDTESVNTADVNSFLDRSNVLDVTSPLSPEAPKELIDVTASFEESKVDETVVSGIKENEAPAALPEVAPEAETKEKVDEAVVAAAVGVTAVAAAAATAAVIATKDKKPASKPSTKTSLTKKPASKLAPTAPPKTTLKSPKAPAKSATPSPAKPPPSKTAAKPLTASKLPATKSAAPKALPKPKPETAASKPAEKKPLLNGDIKLAKKTSTTLSSARSAPSKALPSPTKTETKSSTTTTSRLSATSTKVTSSSSNSAAAKSTTKPVNITAPKPRPTSLTARPFGSTATGRPPVATTKTTVPPKASTTTTLSSPKSTTAAKSPLTAAAKPRTLLKTSTNKGADTEKQIKDSVNKRLTATSRTTTKTVGNSPLRRSSTTTTVKKTETKSPTTATRSTTTTRTTITSIKATNKKPAEITHLAGRKIPATKTKASAAKPQENGLLTNGTTTTTTTTVIQETTAILSAEPHLVKDLSPVENKLLIDNNSELKEATNVVAD